MREESTTISCSALKPHLNGSGKTASRHNYNPTLPTCCLPNLAHPFSHRKGEWLPNIVDTPGGTLIAHSQGNRSDDILYIPVSPPPLHL